MPDIIQEFEKKQAKRKIPSIKPGDTIKVHQKIDEGDKERIQIFEGVVIKIHRGYGINGNVTVRKISKGIGVEKTFPFHLPSIEKIEVVKRGKVRRAKLYYLRRKQEKEARLKDKKLTEEELGKLGFEKEAPADKKPKSDDKNKKKPENKDNEKRGTTKTQKNTETQKKNGNEKNSEDDKGKTEAKKEGKKPEAETKKEK